LCEPLNTKSPKDVDTTSWKKKKKKSMSEPHKKPGNNWEFSSFSWT
jgi:hypothetical protein